MLAYACICLYLSLSLLNSRENILTVKLLEAAIKVELATLSVAFWSLRCHICSFLTICRRPTALTPLDTRAIEHLPLGRLMSWVHGKGVAMNSLKFHQGPPSLALLCPVGGPPLKQPYDRLSPSMLRFSNDY
jgi:hypothetical protein